MQARELVVAGLRFDLQTQDPALDGALDAWGARVGGGRGGEPIIFESGAETSLTATARGLCVKAPPDDLGPGLRGLLVTTLDRRGSALLHGAGVVVGDGAVLCIAPSEGGKTTLCGKLAGRVPVLSDETVALRLDLAVPTVGGTFFWSGPPLPTSDQLFPLRAICFLRKGSNQLAPLPASAALAELLLEWHLPDHSRAAAEALSRASALVGRVPTFALHTTLEGDPLPLLQAAAGI